MSTRAAGQRFELRCKKYLESVGFTVDKARAALRSFGPGKYFSSPCDFFGCADLIAVHPDKPYTLFVQCYASPGHGPGNKLKELGAVKWNLKAQNVQLWQRVDSIAGGIRTLIRREVDGQMAWGEMIWRMRNGEEPEGGLL